jgi:hypothetical protein
LEKRPGKARCLTAVAPASARAHAAAFTEWIRKQSVFH